MEKFKEKSAPLIAQDRGAIIALTGLLLAILLEFAGLALDLGLWYVQRRNLQFTADSGAAAGGRALNTADKPTIKAYATYDLGINGCTTASNCTFTIHYPPMSGPNTGSTNAVEVSLSQPSRFYLADLFLASTPGVTARAAAFRRASPML
jgi:uncharacterized membrane protein